jgi:hypothetical protein
MWSNPTEGTVADFHAQNSKIAHSTSPPCDVPACATCFAGSDMRRRRRDLRVGLADYFTGPNHKWIM